MRDGYIYSNCKTIRTNSNCEKLFSSSYGFIGFLWDVEYLNRAKNEWFSVGSRWLINTNDSVEIMTNGFKKFPDVKA